MEEMARTLRAWLTFVGCVLVVGILYWAQVVLVPIALASLVTFVLAPIVTRMQRYVGRVAAVFLVVALGFSVLGVAAWVLATQVSQLAADLPAYRSNIRQKIADIRRAGEDSPLEKVQTTFDDIKTEMAGTAPRERARGTASTPIVVRFDHVSDWWQFPAWLGPVIGPMTTAGFVIVMVIFMLLEREELRGRIIGLIGHGHLAVTTKAFEEASERVSRQLLMQAVVNAIYGAGVGIGLALLGVPYALFWAAVGGALRYIPYLGPLLAAGAPILVSLAVLPGWSQPLRVVGLFIALELFTNLVLETVLYAGAAGVSQVALLVAVAFWTWLWGPIGLLLATPLTVCVVVLGKHVQGLEFLSTLMADTPALAPDIAYYQRLLARDQSDAADLIERHLAAQPALTVYDALLLPALNYAERDRAEDRLSAADEARVIDTTRELLIDAATAGAVARAAGGGMGTGAPRTDTGAGRLAAPDIDDAARPRVAVLACPMNGAADELALLMLRHLLDAADADDTSGDRAIRVDLEILSGSPLTSDVIAAARERGVRIVCIADLPPSPPSRTRYLVKKLHAAVPDLRILVGRWAPPSLADENPRALADVGASHVGLTLIETCDEIRAVAARLAPALGKTA